MPVTPCSRTTDLMSEAKSNQGASPSAQSSISPVPETVNVPVTRSKLQVR